MHKYAYNIQSFVRKWLIITIENCWGFWKKPMTGGKENKSEKCQLNIEQFSFAVRKWENLIFLKPVLKFTRSRGSYSIVFADLR